MKQYSGVVMGLVKEIDAALGRIKVDFPWMTPPQRSHWAPIATLMGGKQRGVYFMPEINDEVLLAFDQGDFDHPYVVGFLWNGMDTPPETNQKKRVILTPGGHTLHFEDTDGGKKVILKSSSGHEVVLDDSASGQTITLKTAGAASQRIVLDDKDHSIELQGGERILALRGGQVQIS